MVSSSKSQQCTLCTDTLQRLVLEHLQHLDKRMQPISTNESALDVDIEVALTAIRQAVVDGDISRAILVTSQTDPALLTEHPTLLFELKLQAWIELLRNTRSRPETMLPDALVWLRKELAPLALGAHPETYRRFQAALPLLLSCTTTGAPSSSSNQHEIEAHWSLRRRLHLASNLELTLRNRHNAFGSTFEWCASVSLPCTTPIHCALVQHTALPAAAGQAVPG